MHIVEHVPDFAVRHEIVVRGDGPAVVVRMGDSVLFEAANADVFRAAVNEMRCIFGGDDHAALNDALIDLVKAYIPDRN